MNSSYNQPFVYVVWAIQPKYKTLRTQSPDIANSYYKSSQLHAFS